MLQEHDKNENNARDQFLARDGQRRLKRFPKPFWSPGIHTTEEGLDSYVGDHVQQKRMSPFSIERLWEVSCYTCVKHINARPLVHYEIYFSRHFFY